MNQVTENPLNRLLELLPAKVAEEKRSAIVKELEPLGMLEHFRQTAIRPGFDIGKVYVRVAVILRKHLGISEDFFSDPEAQAKETKELVNYYVQEAFQS